MQFLFARRYNFVDAISITTAVLYYSRGEFAIAVAIYFGGLLISAIGEHYYG